MKKKKLDFENLRDIVWIAAPALSPDGTRAAYLKGVSDYDSGRVETRLTEKNLETGEIWEAPLRGAVQKSPVYAPDGKKLAFLSSDGRAWQVWVKECDSGEAVQVTTLRHGAENPVFSPDGKKIAFEMSYFPGEDAELFQEMTKEEDTVFQKKRMEEPKVIENLIYKLDEAHGMLDGSRTAIGLFDLEKKKCSLVTPLDIPYKVPAFADKGRKLVCYGYPYAHCKEMSAEIYQIDLESGGIRQVKRSVPSYYMFPVQEDEEGNFLYCGAHIDQGSAIPKIFKVPSGGGESSLVFAVDRFRHLQDTLPTEGESSFVFTADPVCHGIDAILSGDTHLEQKDCPFVRDAEGNLYFLSYHMGRSNVYCWDGKELFQVTEEDCILSFDGPANGKMLVLKSKWNQPAELYLLCRNEKGLFEEKCQVTESNGWLSDYELFPPVPVSVKSRDGKAVIRGWAVVPQCAGKDDEKEAAAGAGGPGDGENGRPAKKTAFGKTKIPAILDVHGGPESCYVKGFFYEAQMMASRGMAVLYCDPRGASGYGPEFMKDEYAYGPEAVDDLLAFVQEACRRFPQIDAKRIGVTGGSYGGHMTNKLISVTDAFAAAVTQRTWVNPSSSYGTGDMGFYSAAPQEISFQEYMENRARKSIMKYVRNIQVPLLVLHGEKDYRCALEQGEQVYHALRSLKPQLPVKIVIFPGENHGVTREGLLHNQIRHMREMTEWFEKYLGEEAGRDEA